MNEFNEPIPFYFEPLEWNTEPIEFEPYDFSFDGLEPFNYEVLPLWEHQPTGSE